MLTEKLMRITLAGGSEWVMVLLLVLSVVSVAIILERGLFFRRQRRQLDLADGRLRALLAQGASTKALQRSAVESDHQVLGAAAADPPTEGRGEIVASLLGRERLWLERRLNFLGTLGSNAPFIGLFGTVLGIIRAFSDLSAGSLKGHQAVMAGISEALVATAIGLFVAIPAVIAYNYYQKQVDRTVSLTESLARVLLAATANPALATSVQTPGRSARSPATDGKTG